MYVVVLCVGSCFLASADPILNAYRKVSMHMGPSDTLKTESPDTLETESVWSFGSCTIYYRATGGCDRKQN